MPINPDEPPTVHYEKTDLRDRLDPIEYQVTQEGMTERPFTNKFYKHREKGTYQCIVCDEDMFSSKTKYESGSGWPAFYDVIDKSKLKFRQDASGIGGNLLLIISKPHLIRTEVKCRTCGSHMGHVFQDGPKPTGTRYCINSSALKFRSAASTPSEEDEVISCPATINGCGAGGFCALRSKEAVADRIKEIKDGDSVR